MDTDSLLIVLALVVVLAALVGWTLTRRRQSEALEQHFGPEYHRTVQELGGRDKAEAELMSRRKRVADLDIVPLSPADAQRFSQEWRVLQSRFVDNPRGVLAEADLLVRELMSRRGYPMGEFEQRAADISVHHPGVVEHYRAAHAITERERHEDVDTEGLRQAVIHYRALFAELLQTQSPADAHGHAHRHDHREMRA